MIKIDIFSGFLGAGKTTLIKKLLKEAFVGEKVVLIENEFGEIGIDGGFLKEAGIEITEMNSGCICCSLVGDFGKALHKVIEEYAPDRILIEPSGVGKLSDVMAAVQKVVVPGEVELNSLVAVVNAQKCKVFMKNFGEFFNNQIEYAKTIILSRAQLVKEEKLAEAVSLIRQKNDKAVIITTDWEKLSGAQILTAMEQTISLADELFADEDICPECGCHHDHEHHHEHGEHGHHHDHDHDHEEHGHHHDHDHDHDHEEHDHHHDHGEDCTCGCHDHEEHGHDHDHDHEEHGHHHDHDENCTCGCHDHEGHGHHHDHDENCTCGCHDHDHEHHHHHHADDVFTSWGVETPHKFDKDEMTEILKKLSETTEYGSVLRAKGMVEGTDGRWIYFDLVPEEYELREGSPEITGRICVIGTDLKEEGLKALFKL